MKKNWKAKSILVSASILAVVGISGIIAYFTDTTTVTNHAQMGIVDIDLKEYTMNSEGKKVEWQDLVNVVPGDVLSKIAEIECVDGAADCYVRAKVEISCEDEALAETAQMLTIDDVNINTEDWYYCENDGYFYYKQILTDDSDPIVLFSEVTIPTTLDNKWSLEKVAIEVTAEAIQSRNFTPDFATGSKEPWPGISTDDIEECIYPEHVKGSTT